jgi:hypothetical protein
VLPVLCPLLLVLLLLLPAVLMLLLLLLVLLVVLLVVLLLLALLLLALLLLLLPRALHHVARMRWAAAPAARGCPWPGRRRTRGRARGSAAPVSAS